MPTRIALFLLLLITPVYAQWTGVFNPGGMLKNSVPISSGFPIVQSTAITNQINVTTGTPNLPSSIQSGDLLILLFRGSSPTITTPTGWTLLFDEPFNGTSLHAYSAYKIANGSEGSSVSVTFSGLNAIQCVTYRISNYIGNPEFAKVESTSTNINPPILTPTWGFKKVLWLAVGYPQLASPVGGIPANYTNKQASDTMASAQRQFEASSEDPGTYTQSSSFSFVAATFGIQGN